VSNSSADDGSQFSKLFPFQTYLKVEENLHVHYEDVLEHIFSLLTPERASRVQQVADGRTFTVLPVLENLYDRGNISAVLRSAEAFGFGQVHLIETGERFKESQRTTAGADKWIEVQKSKSTAESLKNLKAAGYKVVATHLSADAKPIEEIDFTQPTALVLGNEKEGISAEMIAGADERVILPMFGFVQSFNISVAASLGFYQAVRDRIQRQGHHGDLGPEEKKALMAVYALRTMDSSGDILHRLRNDKKIRSLS